MHLCTEFADFYCLYNLFYNICTYVRICSQTLVTGALSNNKFIKKRNNVLFVLSTPVKA